MEAQPGGLLPGEQGGLQPQVLVGMVVVTLMPILLSMCYHFCYVKTEHKQVTLLI